MGPARRICNGPTVSETKPFGPNAGEYWDLSTDGDINELEEMSDYGKPRFLTGSPPCTSLSLLQARSKDKRPVEEKASKPELGRKHLRTAVRAYRKQHAEHLGRGRSHSAQKPSRSVYSMWIYVLLGNARWRCET